MKQTKVSSFFKPPFEIRKKRQPIRHLPASVFDDDSKRKVLFPKHKRIDVNQKRSHLNTSLRETANIASILPAQPNRGRGRPALSQEQREAKLTLKYQKLYKWLKVENNLYFCNYCQEYCGEMGIFSFQRAREALFIFVGSNNMKKDSLSRHTDRLLHRKAILRCGSENEKLKALETFISKDMVTLQEHVRLQKILDNKEGLLPIFRYIYFMAKYDLPLTSAPRFYELFSAVGVQLNKYYI